MICTSSYITINDGSGYWGDIASGDSVENTGDPYNISVNVSTPVGTSIEFSLPITADGGYEDTLNFSLTVGTPGLDFATHDCGNVKFTVTRYGALGFMGSASGSPGVGFIYPISGPNHLYYGGFAAGNSASYCVDRYYEQNSQDDTDWNTTTSPDGMVRMYEPGPNNLDEYTTARYDDSGHPSPKGLVCEQYSWAWDDATANDFVIMKFVLRNEGTTTLSNVYAAVFMDWDIGSSPTSNQGSSETARNLTWMYYTTPFVGVEILDPPRSTPAANLALIDHATYVYPNGGLPDNIQIQFMDGSIVNPSSDRAYDWSTCNSVGPFTLTPGDTRVVAFAVLGGDNLNDLKANADTAYSRYYSLGVKEVCSQMSALGVKLSPSISHNRPFTLQYSFAEETSVQVKIYDVLGRLVKNKNYGRLNGAGELSFSLRSFAQGVYFAKIEIGNKIQSSKIIWLK